VKLSRALSVAGRGLDVRAERLRAIAQALAKEQGKAARPPQSAGAAAPSAAEAREAARQQRANLLAVQASRRLLARTVDMLM